jgi:threonine aldolase
MAQAAVGDDVYGEDPTVNQLQEMAAEITGHQAALFVPSGTMGNLAAILAHCQRGDEIIVGDKAHNFLYEAGGIAALGGVQPHPILNQPDGTLALGDIEAAIRPDDAHFPPTRLIALENTHNRCGGAALTVAYTRSVAELAKSRGLKLHLDGARIFNAAISLGVPAKELTDSVDTVTFCLSKALSAPVGSLICGSTEFVARAHRMRKQLGGGMRQAGVLAAAGIIALEQMVERLREDHARAGRLAELLANVKGITIETQNTNMVYLKLSDDVDISAQEVAKRLKEKGVKVGVVGEKRFRLVTHVWIDDAGVDESARLFGEVLTAG